MKIKTVPEYTEQQNNEFCRLIKKHKGVIYHKIAQCPFVDNEFDREDYFQSCLITAWIKFHFYTPRGDVDFGSWLAKISQFAILKFRRDYFRTNRNTRYVEDMRYSDLAEEDYSEKELIALRAAIEDLPEKESKSVEIFLASGNFEQQSKENGKCHTYYSHFFSSAIRTIRGKKNQYFEDKRITTEKLDSLMPKKNRTKRKHSLTKPVDQLDLSGNLVMRWPSLAEAENIGGFKRTRILNAIAFNEQYDVCRWRYAEKK